MLHTKFRENRPPVLDKTSFEWFLPYMYMSVAAILCGFHTRARSVTIATIDKLQLIGTICQNLTF